MATIQLTNGQAIDVGSVRRLPRAAIAITPSDTDDYSAPLQVYVGVTGNVIVEPWQQPGSSVTFTAFPAGQNLPVEVRKVLAAGTTASGLIGIY